MKSNKVQFRLRKGMRIPVLGFCLLVLFVSCAVADVVQWQPCSFSFTAVENHPGWTFLAQAYFVHEESQTQQSIEAYWDGGQTWVVRFAPSLSAGENRVSLALWIVSSGFTTKI
jgi:hypothetical protein